MVHVEAKDENENGERQRSGFRHLQGYVTQSLPSPRAIKVITFAFPLPGFQAF